MENLKEFASRIASNLEIHFGLFQEEIYYTVDVIGGEFKVEVFMVNPTGMDIKLCNILLNLTSELKFKAIDIQFQLLPDEEFFFSELTMSEAENYVYDKLKTDRIKFIIENLR